MNMHVPIESPRQQVTVCLTDNVPWPCAHVDAYWLPKDDSDGPFDDVSECTDPHLWGPWVLSPVYGNREDRFCVFCGSMEMQTISGTDEGRA